MREDSNWETRETSNLIMSYDDLYRDAVEWSKNFHRKIRKGTFDPDKAKYALSKYLLKEVKRKARSFDSDIDFKKVDMDVILDEVLSLVEPEIPEPKTPKKRGRPRKNIF